MSVGDELGVPDLLSWDDLVDDDGFTCGDGFLEGGAAGFSDDEMGLRHDVGQCIGPA